MRIQKLPIPLLNLSDRLIAVIEVGGLVRIIAGLVAGVTLASFGVDVICVNYARLPYLNVREITRELRRL